MVVLRAEFAAILVGSIGKSVVAFWNPIYYIGFRIRWCASTCPVKNATTCHHRLA
jgi:hypothetical protein